MYVNLTFNVHVQIIFFIWYVFNFRFLRLHLVARKCLIASGDWRINTIGNFDILQMQKGPHNLWPKGILFFSFWITSLNISSFNVTWRKKILDYSRTHLIAGQKMNVKAVFYNSSIFMLLWVKQNPMKGTCFNFVFRKKDVIPNTYCYNVLIWRRWKDGILCFFIEWELLPLHLYSLSISVGWVRPIVLCLFSV